MFRLGLFFIATYITSITSELRDLESPLEECTGICNNFTLPVNSLQSIKADLERDGYKLIPGKVMYSILRKHGASIEDLALMESGYIHERLPRDMQPVMSHRSLSIHRMLLDDVSGEISSADTNACTQIARKDIASSSAEGSKKLHFKRESSIPRALSLFIKKLMPQRHHPQDNIDISRNVTINDQVLIRVRRKPVHDDSYSPTPEGIHQDNTEISTVTMVRRQDIKEGGESRIWRLATPTGNYPEEDFLAGKMQKNLKLNRALQDPWETVVFNDRKVKHEARAFSGGLKATRDVIVTFNRKPLKDGSDRKLRKESFVEV